MNRQRLLEMTARIECTVSRSGSIVTNANFRSLESIIAQFTKIRATSKQTAQPTSISELVDRPNLSLWIADRVTETGETANEGGPYFSKLRITSNTLLVRKLVGENINPVNFRRFGKEVARLDFFHQSRRHFAI
jgi:hypothetical protein